MVYAKLLQHIVRFLNMPPNASFEEIRDLLQQVNLCKHELLLSDTARTSYSLYTRQEVMIRQAQGLPVSKRLADAVAYPRERGLLLRHGHRRGIVLRRAITLARRRAGFARCAITSPHYAAISSDYGAVAALRSVRVVFPEDGDNSDTGGTAQFKQAFEAVFVWFQVFMAKCAAGSMDISLLNSYISTSKLCVAFRTSKDTMNPILAPTEIRKEKVSSADGDIKRSILMMWIYPFLFSSNGRTLSRVRCCQQCGRYFISQRISAVFCSSKCRMTNYYKQRPELTSG